MDQNARYKKAAGFSPMQYARLAETLAGVQPDAPPPVTKANFAAGTPPMTLPPFQQPGASMPFKQTLPPFEQPGGSMPFKQTLPAFQQPGQSLPPFEEYIRQNMPPAQAQPRPAAPAMPQPQPIADLGGGGQGFAGVEPPPGSIPAPYDANTDPRYLPEHWRGAFNSRWQT